MSLKADEADAKIAQHEQNALFEQLEAQGVRGKSLDRIKALLEHEIAGGYVPGPNQLATLANVYKPDSKNDRARTLQNDLKRPGGIMLEVWCDTPIGTRESLTLQGDAAKRYLNGDLRAQAETRGRALLERHLGVAIEAATRLRARGLTESVRPAALLEHVSATEAVCLKTFGALQTTRIRESVGEKEEETALESLRPGFEHDAARVKTQAKRIGLTRMREVLGLDTGGDTITAFSRLPLLPGWIAPTQYPYEKYLQYGPNQQQMLLNDVWDEQAKCAYRYARDPICKQAIRIKTNYVLGRGVSVSAPNPDVQAVLDEFNDRMKMDRLASHWVNSLGVRGELFLREIQLSGKDDDGDDQTGRTSFRKLPAPSIWELHTDPEDVDAVIDYVQRYRTRTQLFAPQLLKWIDRIVPAAEVIHYKINADDDEVRGRGDPYAALAWHERFINFWDAESEKDYASSAFQFWVKIIGTNVDVQNFIRSSVPQGRPAPGGWLVFNDKVEDVGVVKSDMNSPAGRGSSNDGLLNIIAANYQISKTYLGVEGYQSRAGATVQVGPAEKGFEERQDDVNALLGEVYDRVLDNAQAAGLIPADLSDDELTYTINFPAIIKADSDQRIKNIVIGRSQGFVSHAKAGEMWATEMDIAASYDYEDEQKKIADEAEKGVQLPPPLKADAPGADWPQQGPPGAGGPPDPTSAAGAAAIRKKDGAPATAEADIGIRAALEVLRQSGAIVLLS